MLGGLKAALRRDRSGPILPLSGDQIIRSGHHPHHPPIEIFSDESSRVTDEEAPRSQCHTPTLHRRSATPPAYELDMLRLEADAALQRQQEFGTFPSAMKGGLAASQPQLASAVAAATGSLLQPAAGLAAPVADGRMGTKQLVINVALDIFGPTGLLAQLGLPGVQELEAQCLRVQCKSVDVQPTIGCHGAAGVSAQRVDVTPSFAGAPTTAQQFFIGEDEQEVSPSQLLQDTLSPDSGSKVGSPDGPASAAGGDRGPRRPKPTSSGAMAALRPAEAGRRQGGGASHSRTASTAAAPSARTGRRPLDLSRVETDATLKERDELHRQNLKLESDLIESLQGLRDEALSTPSSAPTDQSRSTTPQSSSLGGTMKALFRRGARREAAAAAKGSSRHSAGEAYQPPAPARASSDPRVFHRDDDDDASRSMVSCPYSDAHTEMSAPGMVLSRPAGRLYDGAG